MTTQEFLDYYANLLIIQYRKKPKAYATIQASVRPFIQEQILLAIRDCFNIDTAVGVQLDVLGKYAGVSRLVNTFTMGTVVLNDSDYRILVRMKLALNNMGSSLADIQLLLFDFFSTTLRVFDHANMHMNYYFNSMFGSQELAEAMVLQGLLPKPMGVQLGATVYIPTLTNIFGMRDYTFQSPDIVGFNSYGTYHTDWTWLSYANAI